MTIEEIKRRLEDDYRVGREWAKEQTSDLLEDELAKLERELPRFAEETVIEFDEGDEGTYAVIGLVGEQPPEDEIESEMYWDDPHGRTWWYDAFGSQCWIARINSVTQIRAIRDELTDRLSREFTHEQVGYDS